MAKNSVHSDSKVFLNEVTLRPLLQEAIDSGVLSPEQVFQELWTAKKAQLSQVHPYKLTPPPKEGGRWQTCYVDSTGKRKNLKAPTKEELLDKLVPVYFPSLCFSAMTFYDLYKEWLIYKQTVTDSPNTLKRHKQHYRKYFEPSALHNKQVKETNELLLEMECNRIVREFHLSRKEWYNIKTILNGMFRYAVRKKYLSENPMKKVQILVRFQQVIKKTGKTETYNSDELTHLNQYLDHMYAETGDTVFLAVKLNFLIGLRVGELAALKWDDYFDNSHLHIVREEIRNQVANQYEIVEHTKTNRDRFIVLVPKAVNIVQQIERTGDYIFMRNGQRITSRQIAYVLEKYAKRQGVATKSTHKMRKTFASNLNAGGVPLDCIREQLGHSDLSTTLGYIYNPLTEQDTYDLISKAL